MISLDLFKRQNDAFEEPAERNSKQSLCYKNINLCFFFSLNREDLALLMNVLMQKNSIVMHCNNVIRSGQIIMQNDNVEKSKL